MSFFVHGHGNVTFVKQGWLLILENIKLLWLLIVFKHPAGLRLWREPVVALLKTT